MKKKLRSSQPPSYGFTQEVGSAVTVNAAAPWTCEKREATADVLQWEFTKTIGLWPSACFDIDFLLSLGPEPFPGAGVLVASDEHGRQTFTWEQPPADGS